jgi:hypothetical protein
MYGETFLVAAFIGLVVCGVIAAAIGPGNGWSSGTAFMLGFFLGIIGILIVALAKGSAPSTTDVARQRQWEEMVRWQAWQQQPPPQQASHPPQEAKPVPPAVATYIPCPECSTSIPATAKRCPTCATQLSICEQCGGVIPLAEMVCRFCGAEYYDDEIEDEKGGLTSRRHTAASTH